MKTEERNNIVELTFEVVEGAGGVGKTRDTMQQKWTTFNGKRVLLSTNHKYLEEQEQYLKNYIHWFGAIHICPLIKKDKCMNQCVKSGVPMKIVCEHCKENELYPQELCPYKQQFEKDVQNYLMPIDYVSTKKFQRMILDFIVADDCLMKINPLPTFKSLNEKLLMLCGHEFHVRVENLINYNNGLFEESMRKLRDIEHTKDKELLIQDKAHKIRKISEIDYTGTRIADIHTIRYLYKKHGLLKRYGVPAIFEIFNYLAKNQSCKFRILEAIPNYDLLDLFINRYYREKGIRIKYTTELIPTPTNKRKNQIVRLRHYSRALYPCQKGIVMNGKNRRRIRREIERKLMKYPDEGVDLEIGFIIPKACRITDFIDTEKYKNVRFLNFGNLRGKNLLEFSDIGFVIGSYIINKEKETFIELYEMYFAKKIKGSLDTFQSHGDRIKFVDKELEALRMYFEEYEQYQAIMRFRPLTNDCDIFCFAPIPDYIRNEFDTRIETLQREESEERKGEKKKRMKWLEEFVVKNGETKEIVIINEFIKKFGLGYKGSKKAVDRLVNDSDILKFERSIVLDYQKRTVVVEK